MLLSKPPWLTFFLGDPKFPTAFNTGMEFDIWSSHGLVTLDSLLQGTSFCSLEYLQHTYAFPNSEFYKYSQICHFFTDILTQDGEEARTLFENLCREGSRDRGIISTLYRCLNDHHTMAKSSAMLSWGTETEQQHSAEDWLDMVSNIHKCSVAIKEAFDSILWIESTLLFQIRALGDVEKEVHSSIFWSCTALQSLWQQTSMKVLQITGTPITLTYQMCILYADLLEVPPLVKNWVTLFSAIHWAIALNWWSPSVQWSQVLLRMESIKLLERIYYTLIDSMQIFDRKWDSWPAY